MNSTPAHSEFDTLPADPAAERTARHAAILQELAALGMALVRRVVEQAAEPAMTLQGGEAGAVQGDPGLSFSRLSRAVRLTLESRLSEADKPAAPAVSADVGAKISISRINKVAYAVEDLIQNTDEEFDRCEIESLLDDMNERLPEIEADDGFERAPISAVVGRICADLGLTPDWTLWACEDWAKAEARDGVAGSPYGRPDTPAQASRPIPAGGASTLAKPARDMPKFAGQGTAAPVKALSP